MVGHFPVPLQNTGVYSPFIHLVSGTDPEGSQVKHQARQSQTLQTSYTGLRNLKRSFVAPLKWGAQKEGGKSAHSPPSGETASAEEKILRGTQSETTQC